MLVVLLCCKMPALLVCPAGAAFYCWSTALPHRGLDVWTFWSRIQEHGAAFSPRSSSGGGSADSGTPVTPGVWPLLFLKGSLATLLAIGKDKEQVAQLRSVISGCRIRLLDICQAVLPGHQHTHDWHVCKCCMLDR